MKITIDLKEDVSPAFPPNYVYRRLFMEHWERLQKKHDNKLWGLANACDISARALYSHKTGRSQNVKNLILTYTDAEECFELFKQFADVWVRNCSG